MSRRFDWRMKCRLPIRMVNGDTSINGEICDVSPTHFKAHFKVALSTLKKYRFHVTIGGHVIDGDGKVDKTLIPSPANEHQYVILMENLYSKDDVDLITLVRQHGKDHGDRRTSGATEFAKKRRKADRNASRMLSQRIVISGIGVVSPIGIGREAFWQSILDRKTGVGRIAGFDVEPFPIHIAAEVSDKEIRAAIPPNLNRRMGRATKFAWLAAKLALEDAEIELEHENRDRIGVAMGTTLGTLDWAFDQYKALAANGFRAEHPYTIAAGSSNAVSGEISVEHGLRGISLTISQGCTSSSVAISHGVDAIHLGRADVMLVGGADAPLNPTVFGAFVKSGMLAKTPAVFDKNGVLSRDHAGAVLGEGGCVLVLESYQHAKQRNAPILAEIVGSGFASDGYDMIYPHPSGRGIARAIRGAIDSAQIDIQEIDLIMGHLSGLRLPNLIEMKALRRELGAIINTVPITNIKPLIGYTQGACGAFEVAAGCLGFHEVVPWLVYNSSQTISKSNMALINCVGFGGKNIALIVKRVIDE
jgi:3-oxoacyl-[acyl-carrier-protein] synthase II